MAENDKMSFLEHLEELRGRLIKCAVAVIGGMIVCWIFRDRILSFLVSPLYEAWSRVDGLPAPGPLNFTDMLEPFVAYLKISAVGGLFVAAPFVLYQLWKFVAPGLYPKERRLAIPFVFASTVLFVGGALTAYAFVFPVGFAFFLNLSAGREMTELESKVEVTAPESSEPPIKQPPSVAEGDAGPSEAVVGPDAGDLQNRPGDEVPEKKTEAKTVDRNGNRPPEPPRAGAEAPAVNRADGDKNSGVRFWARLLSNFGKEECAEFSAVPLIGKPEVKLFFTWDALRCGAPPNIDRLKRNDSAIVAVWRETTNRAPGPRSFAADDTVDGPGDYIYKLAVPADPGALVMVPVLMVKDYLTLSLQLLLAFGIVFELPILIVFLALAGIVNYKQLLKFSRWFIVIAFVVGAVLTPPDALSQLMLALPMIALYFLSVLVVYLFGPKPL